jgi:hypothetical protein
MHEHRKSTSLKCYNLFPVSRLEHQWTNQNFAKEYFVDKAINEAAFVLERIDRKWPSTG